MVLFTTGLILWVVIPFYDSENNALASRTRMAHYFGHLCGDRIDRSRQLLGILGHR